MGLGAPQTEPTAATAGDPAGRLVSVNVGMPKDVPWQGKTVFTGVFKDPVTGPRRVGKLNVDGDGQGDLAGHGGEQRAVFVYQIDSYRYWERELGRDDFVYGQFGENFTVEGTRRRRGLHRRPLPDRHRHLRGNATSRHLLPRRDPHERPAHSRLARFPPPPGLLLPRARRGRGTSRRRDHQARFRPRADAGRRGRRACSTSPGTRASNCCERSGSPPSAPAGRPRSKLCSTKSRAAATPGLAVTSPPPAWPGFRQLTVTAITRESDSVISIRLEDPTGAPLPAARPGQYLTLRVQPDKQQRSVLRNYSLSGPPGAGYYRITVKREPDGVASGYLHTRLAVGDQLDIAAPRGTFILDRTQAPVLLISAGIGATPVLAMLQALAEEHSDREIWWLHGARNSREHSFAAEAQALLASLPNARTHVYYSRPGPDDLEGRDFDSAGRLTGISARRTRATPRCRGIPVRAHGRSWTRSAPVWRALGARRLPHPHRAVRARTRA